MKLASVLTDRSVVAVNLIVFVRNTERTVFFSRRAALRSALYAGRLQHLHHLVEIRWRASCKGVLPCRSDSAWLAPACSKACNVAWWRGPPSPSTMDSMSAVQCRLFTQYPGAPAATNCRTTPACPRCAAAIRAVPS